MANNKRKPTPSVFGKGNVMDEILSGAPTPKAAIIERGSEQISSDKMSDGTNLPKQVTPVKIQSPPPEPPEKSPTKSRAEQGSPSETERPEKIGKSNLENDPKRFSGQLNSNGTLEGNEASVERERNILPNSNKEHVDFLFSIDLVDKMEEVFPRLRRQMPTGQRRAFSKSVFVELCVAEILWDFKKTGDASRLSRMVKQFAEELSERKAGQRFDENGR